MFLGEKKAVKAKIILENLFKVIKLNNEILLKASEIYCNLKREGKLIEDADLLIGSTAIVYNPPLLTLNKKHFERLIPFGLKIL